MPDEKRVGAEFAAGGDALFAGAGISVLNFGVGITPSIAIPFSAGSSDPIFSIRLSFNFGR
jgi:hypothetical protein